VACIGDKADRQPGILRVYMVERMYSVGKGFNWAEGVLGRSVVHSAPALSVFLVINV
jgi:hypothetical protein